MKRACIATATLTLFVVASVVGAKEQTLKERMGENFAGLQQILISLITANYAAVPTQVRLIHDHATALAGMVPDNAQADRNRFLSYAYELRTHADDLDSIVRVLMEHDKGKKQLATDSLREAAAAHYGGMVTMCVACHNRFRPTALP